LNDINPGIILKDPKEQW